MKLFPSASSGCGLELDVQQYHTPSPARPQSWLPRVIAVNVNPLAVGCGVNTGQPQQYTAPSVVRPHVRLKDVASAWNRWPPATGTGVRREVVVPSPLFPPWPQQYAAPPTVRAHAFRPTVTVAKVT